MPGAQAAGQLGVERREGVEEARRGLLAVGVELAADGELQRVARGAQRGRGALGGPRREQRGERRDQAAAVRDQLRGAVGRQPGVGEAIGRQPVAHLGSLVVVGERVGAVRSRGGVEHGAHAVARADHQEAVRLRAGDAPRAGGQLDAVVFVGARARSGDRVGEGRRPVGVVDVEQVDPVGGPAGAGKDGERGLVAEPGLHVPGEVEARAPRPRDQPRRRGHGLVAEQRHASGQAGERLVLVAVRVEVGVQVGERVRGHQRLGVVGRRAAVAARERARQVRDREGEDRDDHDHDADRGDEAAPGDDRQRAPEAAAAPRERARHAGQEPAGRAQPVADDEEHVADGVPEAPQAPHEASARRARLGTKSMIAGTPSSE